MTSVTHLDRDESIAPATHGPAFDDYARDYDAALAAGLSATGEDGDYFARNRAAWLARCLDVLRLHPRRVLDFGCGTGSGVPFLLGLLKPDALLGVDVSTNSLEQARQARESSRASFATIDDTEPDGSFDLAFSNGVFHHIPLATRADAVRYIRSSLVPGGLFALWENNPWNPGTRYVMSRIPFDSEAVPLTAAESRDLLRTGGFEVLRTDFLFIFPRSLRHLRFLEPRLARWPIGGQYQILARAAG